MLPTQMETFVNCPLVRQKKRKEKKLVHKAAAEGREQMADGDFFESSPDPQPLFPHKISQVSNLGGTKTKVPDSSNVCAPLWRNCTKTRISWR